METRSHKRVEGTAQRPSLAQSSRGNKRARLSSAFASSPIPPHARLPIRTLSGPAVANLRSQIASVDLGMETSGSGSRREHEEGEIEKGKEKEKGVGVINHDSDGEENEVEGVSGLHQNFTTASSALQGLLRKLGAGLDDLLPPSIPSAQQSSRFKKILSSLRAEGEIGRQVEALTQLCETLSIATEDSLSSFSVDTFVPVLVGLLNSEGNADIMLLAARALTHLCDVLPHSCASVVHYGAIPSFCARLLTIEYMDLAEQSLQALEKISHEHPAACLRAGALMAVLSYLDFFSTGVQRVALSTAANICKKLPCDAADFVMEAVPILTNLLQYQDSKVIEHASVCLTGIAESFAASSEKLDELCNHGLVAQAARLISVSSSGSAQTSLSTQTYTGLIRLLSTFSSGSASSVKTLLDLNISTILKNVLAVSSFVSSISGSPALNRPPDQTYEIVMLLNELLPPLPQGTISLPPSCSMGSKCPAKKHIPDSNTEKPEDIEEMLLEISDREKILRDQPDLLAQFGMDLFPVLVQVYGSSVNSPVRHKCLTVISKLVYFSTADMLLSLLRVTNIPSFLSGILAWKDPQVLVTALHIAEVLIQKLPDVFPKMFVKEGVVHAVDTLTLSDLSSPSLIQASVSGKHQYISTLALPKSACDTLCSSESNGEVTVKDELNCSNAGRVDSSLLSGEGIIPTIKSDLLSTVSAHAKHFKDTYFPAHSGVVDMAITESLCKLKTLCMKLNNYLGDVAWESKGQGRAAEIVSIDDKHLLDVIAAILTELGKGDGVSTFEFVESRVITSLLKYFSCGALSKADMTDEDSSKVFKQALKRFKLFIRIALPFNREDGGEAPMTILVRKLQSALSVSERFPVILNHASKSRNGNAGISAGLNTLSQPFKLRFSRAEGEITLRDYSSNTMYIESLATLAAIEEFLWPRIQKNEPSQKSSAKLNTLDSCAGQPAMTSTSSSAPIVSEHQPSTRSTSSVAVGSAIAKYMHGANASSLKGKEKAVLKNIVGERKCPPIKNPPCAKAASDRSSQSKQPQGNYGAEEEEFDVSPVEIDDAAAMEEDISEDGDDEYEEHEEHLFGDEQALPCVIEKVHDVQLGNTIDDSAMASSSTTCNPSQQSPGACTGSTISSGTVEIAEFFRGAAVVSKGSLSFARDAVSGLVSSSGRGSRGSRYSQALPMVNPSLVSPRLNFFIGGKQLNRSLTVYQVIQQHVVADEDDMKMFNASEYASGEGRRLWDEVYNITYQRAAAPEVNVCAGESMSHSSVKPNKSCAAASSKQALLLNSILQGELPCDLEKSNCTYDILLLLRVLEGLNRLAPYLRVEEASDAFAEGKIGSFDELKIKGPVVPQEEFLNSKLTSKLARQIQDPVASCSGVLPPWCQQLTKACPFLFPFETRRHYFHLASFGLSHAVQRFQQQQSAENSNLTNHQELRIGRLQRQKVRVSRNHILDSASKVMEMFSCHRAVLEVEYFGEVGTGLGPTLEFYTLLSHELQKQVLGMWRSSSFPVQSAVVDNVEMQVVGENGRTPLPAGEPNEKCTVESEESVQAPLGLFPRPWPVNTDCLSGIEFSKVIGYFRLLGQVMAKALQDGRLLDLPFSSAFYRLVLGQELDLLDIQSFDLELGSNLQDMQVLVCRKKFLESLPGDNRKAISELRFHNARIEDLCLDFTLPGYSDYALKPGGNDIMVDMDNLEEYVSLVVDATVKTGIMPQMEAFQAGFNQVFSLESLQIFSENELESLLCGGHDLWAAHTLVDHIKFDHGYTSSSPVIINFLEIIGEFTPDQQRAFLRFVTGAPRLPPGGLAALSPKLTIVRKHFTGANGGTKGTAAQAADGDLPSVMTCANYLKLPPYSCKEVMRDRLLYAITEGQGSFDLS